MQEIEILHKARLEAVHHQYQADVRQGMDEYNARKRALEVLY